jgi:hypothetical protein
MECQMQSPKWQWQGLLQCPQWSELGTVCFRWQDSFLEWKEGVELSILFLVFWQGWPGDKNQWHEHSTRSDCVSTQGYQLRSEWHTQLQILLTQVDSIIFISAW